MIVDAHVHYIEPATADRPYVHASAMAPISVDEVIRQARLAGVDRIVQVTASTMGTDNRYSIEGAQRHPESVLGVVGRFDPLGGDVRDRLHAYWTEPCLLAIRLTLFHEWSRHWLDDGSLDPFLKAAGQLGVPVCLHAPRETRALADTVRRHQGVRFIVDHMNIRYERGMTAQDCFSQWPDLLALAAEPNVWIKLSYFPESAFASEGYPYPNALARMRQLYETVGAERMVWGSNFPPVGRACSYREALDFFRVHCATFITPADLSAILGGTFVREFSRTVRQQERSNP